MRSNSNNQFTLKIPSLQYTLPFIALAIIGLLLIPNMILKSIPAHASSCDTQQPSQSVIQNWQAIAASEPWSKGGQNAIQAINDARQAEGCPALSLPSNFLSEPAENQAVDLFNAERKDRGLSTISGPDPVLEQIAINQSKAIVAYSLGQTHNNPFSGSPSDRLTANPFINGKFSSWGELTASAADIISSDFLFMYNDELANWGNRGIILGNFNIMGPGIAPAQTGVEITIDLINANPGYTQQQNADTIVPNLLITSPTNHAITGASATITASATDNDAVRQVVFFLDSITSSNAVVVNQSPYQTTFSNLAFGTHTVHVFAIDRTNNFSESDVTITFPPPTPTPSPTPIQTVTPTPAETPTPTATTLPNHPAVQILSPKVGDTVNGSVSFTVQATKSDGGQGIIKVEWYIDNTLVNSSSISQQEYITLTYSWDTTTSPDGQHKLTSVAYDANGLSTTSSIVSVTIKNTSSTNTAGPPVSSNSWFNLPIDWQHINLTTISIVIGALALLVGVTSGILILLSGKEKPEQQWSPATETGEI